MLAPPPPFPPHTLLLPYFGHAIAITYRMVSMKIRIVESFEKHKIITGEFRLNNHHTVPFSFFVPSLLIGRWEVIYLLVRKLSDQSTPFHGSSMFQWCCKKSRTFPEESSSYYFINFTGFRTPFWEEGCPNYSFGFCSSCTVMHVIWSQHGLFGETRACPWKLQWFRLGFSPYKPVKATWNRPYIMSLQVCHSTVYVKWGHLHYLV